MASAPLLLGIDLGGTQLRAGIVTPSGKVLRRAAVATDAAGGPEAVVAQIAALANEVAGSLKDRLSAAGVAAPGPLDSEAGTVLAMQTLRGWRDYPLRDVLALRLGLPVVIENDGIAAAVGEWQFGAGRGLRHLVYVTVSTGIGGGVIADGRVLRGHRGLAGHVGHMIVAPDGPRCFCGNRGCFEALASGSAFNDAARVAGFADARAAVEAARGGNAEARAVVDREADLLAGGFASLVHLFSPQRIVMGGGVAQSLDMLQPRLIDTVRARVMAPFRAIDIAAAQLGDNAGLVGAGHLALQNIVARKISD